MTTISVADIDPHAAVFDCLDSLRRYARTLTLDDDDADDVVRQSAALAVARFRNRKTGFNVRQAMTSILRSVLIDRASKAPARLEVDAHQGVPGGENPLARWSNNCGVSHQLVGEIAA